MLLTPPCPWMVTSGFRACPLSWTWINEVSCWKHVKFNLPDPMLGSRYWKSWDVWKILSTKRENILPFLLGWPDNTLDSYSSTFLDRVTDHVSFSVKRDSSRVFSWRSRLNRVWVNPCSRNFGWTRPTEQVKYTLKVSVEESFCIVLWVYINKKMKTKISIIKRKSCQFYLKSRIVYLEYTYNRIR